MITFYCGLIENDAVVSYNELNIVAHTEFVSTYTDSENDKEWSVTSGGETVKYPLTRAYYIGDNLPETTPAINWVIPIFNALGADPSNYNLEDIADKKIYCFSRQNINSKLPFYLKISSTANYTGAAELWLHDDNGHGIALMGVLAYNNTMGITNISGCYAIMKPGVTATSLRELLHKCIQYEQIMNTNESWLSAVAYNVDMAPFMFYCVRYQHWETSGRKYSIAHINRSNPYGDYFGTYRNLKGICNWITLLLGDMPVQPPVFYLAEEHNGFKYIELSVPMYPINTGYTVDKGIHKANTSGSPANTQVYGYGNVIVGTDLTQVLEVGETISLKNGSTITRTSNSFQIASGGVTYTSKNAHTYNSGTTGTYILLSSSLALTNPNNWKEALTATTTPLEYNPDRVMFSLVTNSFIQSGQLGNSWFSGVGDLINNGSASAITPYVGGYVFNSYSPAAELASTKFLWNWSVGMYDELYDREGNAYSPSSNTGDIGSIDYTGGGYSPSNGSGGSGSYDTSTDNVNGINSNIAGATGASNLFKIYNVTMNAINAIGSWANSLFSSLYGVVEAIISLKQIRVPDNLDLTGDIETLKVAGNIISDDGVIYNGMLLNKQIYYANLGSVYIEEYYGSFLDYEGYTDVELYLPFAGTYKLDTNLVMNSTLSIKCGVDTVSGTVVYDITIENDDVNSVVYTFTGNCANDMPVTYTDYSGKISGFVNTAIGLAGALVAPGATGAAIGASAMTSGAMTIAQTPGHGSKGSAGKNAGYAMPSYPYLIITRPIRQLPENYGSVIGFPAEIGGTVGTFAGYTVLSDINLTGIVGATDDELAEIDRLVKEGVYV